MSDDALFLLANALLWLGGFLMGLGVGLMVS